jgi:hypothetical protein
MRFAPLLLFVACAHTATPVRVGEQVPRDRFVLAGELAGAESLLLAGTNGKSYRVVASGGRFSVSLPAGVYDVGGQTVSGIPGDVIDLGSMRMVRGAVVMPEAGFPTGLPRTARFAARGVSFFSGSAHQRSNETPGRYQVRTGEPTRPLPGPGRAGMGIGLRGR